MTRKSRKSPVLLALETSSPALSAALKAGGGPAAVRTTRGFLRHTENLLPMIDGLLRKKRLATRDIDAFLIGRGPGSFTGLRVGFATLKAFRLVRKKPCYGALSLDMIAEGVKGKPGTRLVIACDARRSKVYTRSYTFRRSGWTADGPPAVILLAGFLENIPPGCWLTGDLLDRHGDAFEPLRRDRKIRLLPRPLWYPRAGVLAECFSVPRMRKKYFRRLTKPEDWIPLYFRLSEAEEKKSTHA